MSVGPLSSVPSGFATRLGTRSAGDVALLDLLPVQVPADPDEPARAPTLAAWPPAQRSGGSADSMPPDSEIAAATLGDSNHL